MFADTVIAKYLSIPSHQKRELTRETKKLDLRVGTNLTTMSWERPVTTADWIKLLSYVCIK